jgi:hypothetical protein
VGDQIISMPQANWQFWWYRSIAWTTEPISEVIAHFWASIKNPPIVDGLKVVKLFEFLESVLKIRRLGQVLDWQLNEIIFLCSRESLADHLLTARAQNIGFGKFHRILLEYLLSAQAGKFLTFPV